MGRGKIEIKRIENSTNRQVTFSKRKNGILKKAREITVLCSAQVSLVIFSNTNKMVEFHSEPVETLLEKYQKTSGKRLWDAKHEYLSKEVDRIRKENDNMQIELRHLKGEDLSSLQPRELIPIEEALLNGLDKVRDKKMEVVTRSQIKMKRLEEENEHLNWTVHQQETKMNMNARNMVNGFHQNGTDYPSEIPFSFCVHPAKPDLQENK